MVLAVCLNGGPDKVYEAPGFALTGVYRPSRQLGCAGGKAINCARVLSRLGHPARVVGFSAGHAGRYMEEALAAEGIEGRYVRVSGESRLATTIMDPASGVHTELNEAGPTVGESDVEAVLRAIGEELPGSAWCAIGGSAPPGSPVDVYARVVATAKEAGVPVLLDTNREWLAASHASGPDVLKPNQAELGLIAGRAVAGPEEAARAAREVVATGAGGVLVTLGAEGARAVTGDSAVRGWVEDPPAALSAVGSGDAFAAGYVAGLLEGGSVQEALSLALCCGTANATVFGPGFFGRGDAEALLARARIAGIRLDSAAD